MVRRQAHRLATTLLVVLSLLFSQLALANYVCPPAVAGPPHEAMDMEMEPGEPCGMMGGMQMDHEQPVLCHQHCIDAPQSFDGVQVPVPSLPAIVHVLAVPEVVDAAGAQSVRFGEARLARPPPDPLFLSTLRLRV